MYEVSLPSVQRPERARRRRAPDLDLVVGSRSGPRGNTARSRAPGRTTARTKRGGALPVQAELRVLAAEDGGVVVVLLAVVAPVLAPREDAHDDGLLARGLPGPVLLLVIVLGGQGAAGEPHREADHEVEAGVGEKTALGNISNGQSWVVSR